MRLDQRATDRAQVVRQPDADAGLLPRLGLAVPRERSGRGDRRFADMAGGFARLAGVRHVLGLHETLDQVDVPVPADGDDASGDGEVLAAELGAGLYGLVDFLQACLDGYGLRFKLGAPVVVIERLKLVQPCLERRDFRALLVGRFPGLRIQPPVGGGVFPRDFGHGEGPLPAGRERVGGRLEPVHGEPVQEHRVLEPGAAGVILGEEVPQDGPAGSLVGVDANKPGDGRHARHAVLGQEAIHVPGGYVAALGGDLFPDRQLALAVGGDGEGLQDLEIDLVGPVGVQQLRRDVAEAEPLLDDPFGRPEPGGDGGDRLPGRGQLAEGFHLVGRMHGDADDVLGERDLFGIAVPGTNQAGHGMVRIDLPFSGQGLQGCEAASACDNGVTLGPVVAGFGGADNEVLEKAERGDRRLDLRIGEGAGRSLPDVLGGEAEQAQRDLPDGWSGHGCNSIHCCLHGWVEVKRGACLSPARPCRTSPLPRSASGRRRDVSEVTMRGIAEGQLSGELRVAVRIRAHRGDAGQVGERHSRWRERVADAALQGDVAVIKLRLEAGGGAEVAARGEDAEHAGQPRHAHRVGRVRRLPRLPDDVEHLALGEVEDRKPVEPGPARARVAIAEFPGRLPGSGGAFLGPHSHGADDAAAEAGIGLQEPAKLAFYRCSLEIRGAPAAAGIRPHAAFLDAVQERLSRGHRRKDQGHACGEGREQMFSGPWPFHVLQRRVDRDELVAGHDPLEQDGHRLRVLAA